MENLEYHEALALLEWQIELGADEAIADAPVDRFAVVEPAKPVSAAPARAADPADARAAPPMPAPAVDATEIASVAAAAAADLMTLKAAMESFEHCALKDTARSLVFADGAPAARVMVIGEAPGREEDQQGRPFVGRAGQMLDRMFAAIGLARDADDPATALYITNMVPWRPPQNREPAPEELSMLGPFMRRHIELADPDILVLMGNSACQGLIGRKGITRLRGEWVEIMGRPAIPMFHPAYLLRKPQEKAKAWADLLSLQARLRTM
jgi:DNA polymerase